MKKIKTRKIVAALLGLFVIVPLKLAAESNNVIVFAAASLKESFEEIGAIFEKENIGAKVTLALAGSQKLAAQLQAGAPADVFASADTVQMDAVVKAGLAATDAVRIFAKNRLVVVCSRKGKPVAKLADLALPDMKILVADSKVPAGNYTNQTLEKMKADTDYGAQFFNGFNANIVSFENDVRSVLNKVQLGEADAGVVYQTDAASADAAKISVLQIPASFNVEAQYVIAPLLQSRQPELTAKFIALLTSERGRAVLKKHGFLAE